MKIHIRRYGKGLPLVFFHGWGFDSQIWLPLVPYLESDYELILVDLPGFGHSSTMEWLDFKDKLLHELPEHFALIGWSMGGLFATRFATEVPKRVSCLINVSSSPRFLLDERWPGVSLELFTRFYHQLTQDAPTTLSDFIKLHTPPGAELAILKTPPTPEGLLFGLSALADWDFREQLKGFNKPVLYVFGRLDPLVPVQTMRSMQILYPDFQYALLKRAAHIPFLSHTDLFLDELRGFIQ